MENSTILIVLIGIGSMLFAGALADEHGRSRSRWVWIAALLGPLAIPLFYALLAASVLRNWMRAQST